MVIPIIKRDRHRILCGDISNSILTYWATFRTLVDNFRCRSRAAIPKRCVATLAYFGTDPRVCVHICN